METFKLVVDGIDLTEEDRERIESGIEKAMVEALAGKGKGMHLHPILQPHHRQPEKFRLPEKFRQITEGMPNGGILITPALEAELPQLMSQEFGSEAEIAPAHQAIGIKDFDASQLEPQNIEKFTEQEKFGGSGGPG